MFQFHKGAIRTRIEADYIRQFMRFNSIKVRLELDVTKVSNMSLKFQFHKGAIRTEQLLKRVQRLQVSIP